MLTIGELKNLEAIQIKKLEESFKNGFLTEEERIRKEIYVRAVARMRIAQIEK